MNSNTMVKNYILYYKKIVNTIIATLLLLESIRLVFQPCLISRLAYINTFVKPNSIEPIIEKRCK